MNRINIIPLDTTTLTKLPFDLASHPEAQSAIAQDFYARLEADVELFAKTQAENQLQWQFRVVVRRQLYSLIYVSISLSIYSVNYIRRYIQIYSDIHRYIQSTIFSQLYSNISLSTYSDFHRYIQSTIFTNIYSHI